MLVRMKYKYFNGCTRKAEPNAIGTVLQSDPVLKDCKFEDERRALKEEFDEGEISQSEYDASRRALLKGRKGKEAPVAIKMELHHGDLVVMHGENLQKYYEVGLSIRHSSFVTFKIKTDPNSIPWCLKTSCALP
jgi:hypothetical protein